LYSHLFSFLWSVCTLTCVTVFWRSPENKKKFFLKYAQQNGFDALNPAGWYSQPAAKIMDSPVFLHLLFYFPLFYFLSFISLSIILFPSFISSRLFPSFISSRLFPSFISSRLFPSFISLSFVLFYFPLYFPPFSHFPPLLIFYYFFRIFIFSI
jgi:hypothetical protein